MKRRDFIKTSLLTSVSLGLVNQIAFGKIEDFYIQAKGKIVTVTGLIEPKQVGNLLPHEHVMSIFGGDAAEKAEYDKNKLFNAVIPYLEKVKATGSNALADCTTAYFGRDPELLKQISERTGFYLLTNTGYYGAANDRYVPKHALKENADELARRWLIEWEHGIADTGIHPGFIKIGVDNGPLSEIDKKLVTAAAKTHVKSGLTLSIHTGDNPEAALEQIEILKQEGVHPSAWIWVHAHNVKDKQTVLEAAKAGAWIEFDSLQPDNVELHLEWIQFMINNGYINQILLSHDGNSFKYGDRPMKTYHHLHELLVPMMKQTGLGNEEINRIITQNPQRAFTVQKRLI